MTEERFNSTVLALFTLILLAPGCIWGAYVATVLWAWFAIPAFGLPPLTIAAAFGLKCTWAMLTGLRDSRVKDVRTASDKFNEFIAIGFFVPLLTLGMGWIAKQWVVAA